MDQFPVIGRQSPPTNDPGQPAAQGTGGRLPRPGWPAKTDLDYLKVAAEVFVLVLVVIGISGRLLTRPGKVVRKAADKQVPGS